MRKIFTQQFVGILGILCSMVLSLTLYAYKSDQNVLKDDIATEIEERKAADIETIKSVNKTYSEHEEFHIQQKADRILRDEKFYLYLDQRFDDMEKLQRAINK